MTSHICLDHGCSHLRRDVRGRGYPTEIALAEQMVLNHFEVERTEALFRSMFDQFVTREVSTCAS